MIDRPNNARSKEPERIFKASFSFLYRFLLATHTIIFSILFLIAPMIKGRIAYLAITLFAIFLAALVDTIAASALAWLFRIRLTKTGIHGGTFWGTPVYMSWAEMETVEPRSIFGIRYLRVRSFRENCPSIWLPRFLADPRGFQETVTDHTSSLHPLRRSLADGGTAARREKLPV